jgi:predicted PurR-regulated permease PerM
MARNQTTDVRVHRELTLQTGVLWVLAVLLVTGACYVLAPILAPFMLAVILTVVVSGPADYMEKQGLPRALASAVCGLCLAAALGGVVAMIGLEARDVFNRADVHMKEAVDLLREATRQVSVEPLPPPREHERNRGADRDHDRGAPWENPANPQAPPGAGAATAEAPAPGGTEPPWRAGLNSVLGSFGSWLLSGIGGLLGGIGTMVLVLAFMVFMLQSRSQWTVRLRNAASVLGIDASDGDLGQIRDYMTRYASCLGLIALGYAVAMTTLTSAMGVPRPLFWGMLSGMLEFVPYLGPLLATASAAIASISLGWWAPLTILGIFAVIHTVEGYVIQPMLVGSVVELDPVTVLFGVLFFGTIWGPIGLVVAMPIMILLRKLLALTPRTEVLEELLKDEDPSEEKDATAEAEAEVKAIS